MKIERHQINAAHIAVFYQDGVAYVDRALTTIARHPDNLYPLHLTGRGNALGGSVVSPNAPEVARSLKLAARAGAGVFAFARADGRPESFTLEEGFSISYAQTTDESLVCLPNWQKAFHFVTIARQCDAFAILESIPYELLMHSSTRSRSPSDLAYRIIDVCKDLWNTPAEFAQRSTFIEWEQFCKSGQDGAAPNAYVKRMTAPLFRVMRELQGGDSVAFTHALTDAIKLHKKYWTSTEKLRKDFEGFVSLPLTAIAALAWDRGLRFHVESDYLPWSWVTGEIFTPKFSDPSK